MSPRGGSLFLRLCAVLLSLNRASALQELAGYTGGDASFLKEDVELQFNQRLFWDSVSRGCSCVRQWCPLAGTVWQQQRPVGSWKSWGCCWSSSKMADGVFGRTCCVLAGAVCVAVGWDALSSGRTAVVHRWQVNRQLPNMAARGSSGSMTAFEIVHQDLCFITRFYLGGPTSVRGFGMYSIGPQSEGKAIAIICAPWFKKKKKG